MLYGFHLFSPEAGGVGPLLEEIAQICQIPWLVWNGLYACITLYNYYLPGSARLRFLVLVTGCTSVGKILDAEVYKITGTDFCPLQEETKEEDRVTALKKILNSGMFYFSLPNAGSDFDLTVRAQKQGDNSYESGNSFFWLVLHIISKFLANFTSTSIISNSLEMTITMDFSTVTFCLTNILFSRACAMADLC